MSTVKKEMLSCAAHIFDPMTRQFRSFTMSVTEIEQAERKCFEEGKALVKDATLAKLVSDVLE